MAITETSTSHEPIKRARSAYFKRWTYPYQREYYRPLIAHNEAVEHAYFSLLLKVKELYLPLQEVAFEYRGKHDRSINCTTMHVFLTKSAYLELECDFLTYSCHLHYDFELCPFKDEILQIIDQYFHEGVALYSPRKDGVATYFKRVNVYHEGKHMGLITLPE